MLKEALVGGVHWHMAGWLKLSMVGGAEPGQPSLFGSVFVAKEAVEQRRGQIVIFDTCYWLSKKKLANTKAKTLTSLQNMFVMAVTTSCKCWPCREKPVSRKSLLDHNLLLNSLSWRTFRPSRFIFSVGGRSWTRCCFRFRV